MWVHDFHFNHDGLHRFSSGQRNIEVLAFFEINPPGRDLIMGLDCLFISKDSEAVEESKQSLF